MYQGIVQGNLGGAFGNMVQAQNFQGFGGFQGGMNNGLQQNLSQFGANVSNLGVGGGFVGMTGGSGSALSYGHGSITRPSVRSLLGQRLNFETLNERKAAAAPTGAILIVIASLQ